MFRQEVLSYICNKRERGNIIMYVFNIANPLTLILLLTAVILLLFLSQELKKSYIAAIPLFASLILLIIHGAQLFTLQEEFRNLIGTLSTCLAVDFIFVGISFFGYLWVDDMEAKEKGKKTIDDSLEWFWKNV